MPSQKSDQSTAVVPVSLAATMEAFASMVSAIPGPEDMDPDVNLARILQATSWDEIDEDQDSLPGGRDMAGRTLVIEGVTRHASTIEGSRGFFVVADAIDVKTGERVKFQTSAGELLAVLVKLHWSDAFPARVRIDKTKTARGFEVVKVAVEGASNDPRQLPSV